MIRDSRIRDSFRNVKKDMDEIRDIHKFSIQAINTKLRTIEKELNYRLDTSVAEIKKKIDARVTNHEHKEIMQSFKEASKKITKVSDRMKELEAMSLDVDDLDKSYVTGHDLEKKLGSLRGKISNVKRQLSNFEEDRFSYASEEKLKSVEQSMIELKSELVLRQDLEQMNDRLDSIEEKFMERAGELKDTFNKLEKDVSDIYSLKKEFVSKEQLANLRKEIRLLVEGLKEIQKIKKKLDKSSQKRKDVPARTPKPSKKRKGEGIIKKGAMAVVDFFVEEGDEKPVTGKKSTSNRPKKKKSARKR